MQSTAILVLGDNLIKACIVGLTGIRKWKGWQRISRGVMTFKEAPEDRDEREPSTNFEFVVVRDREENPDRRLRQEIIQTLEVGEPVMLIEETSEDGRVDFRVVVSGGTIGYVARSKVSKLRAIAAAGANMHCEISYIVRQAEGMGIWVSVGVLRET